MTVTAAPVAPRPPGVRRFVAAAVLVALAFLVAAWWASYEDGRVALANRQSADSAGRRLVLARLAGRLEQAETSQRGYVMTGNATFLGPYAPARRSIRADLSTLTAVFADDPEQRARVAQVRQLVDRKFAEMDLVMALREHRGAAAAIARVNEGHGRDLMVALRQATAEIGRIEVHNGGQWLAALDRRLTRLHHGVAAAGMAGMAALMLILVLLWRQRRRRYAADVAAFDAAADHRAIFDERQRFGTRQEELVSTISHELRTPLTSVIGALGLLRGGVAGDLPATATQLVEIADSNSRRLIRLINDMLEIDRAQTGRLSVDLRPIDLNDVAETACRASLGLAAARQVQFRFVHSRVALPVTGDAERLQQVIANLIANAVHVSPPGGNLTVTTALDHGSGKAALYVDDDGPGVPAEFRERIFGRFEQAEATRTSGTGLGLAISRAIVEQHAGRLWFEDRNGGGTRFAFTIDLRVPLDLAVGEGRRRSG